jgi:DNA-binding CsgD family transcriptional regulator
MDGGRSSSGIRSIDLSRWPLVGRDDELALATDAFNRAGSVVLTGAAGVGKTSLAREILARAAREGDQVEWVAATHAAASVPLGSVAHLVPSGAIGAGRDATLRAVVAALERDGKRSRLLLGVDDAHLLDDASAALVHLLAIGGTASVVATVRSGETPPDSIVALWKDGPAALVALQPLARAEVEAVVTEVLGDLVEGATLHFLWEASGGNALFLRELIRHGIESGALQHEQRIWRWQGGLEPGERLHDLVAMRMGTLDDDERAALELVAVGEPISAACLQQLGVAETSERLERRGLVSSRRAPSGSSSDHETSLGHPLFGEVVRSEMSSKRRDEVRLLLADALDATSDGADTDQFRVVLWRADAGGHARTEQLLAAARRAWALWEPAVAERLARSALESGGPDLEAGYLLGEALGDLGRSAEALDVWSAVEDLPGSDRTRAFLAMAQASTLHFHFDRAGDARTVLMVAAERVQDPSAQQVIAGALSFFGATNPLASAESVSDVASVTPQAVLAAVIEWTGAGEIERAVRAADEAVATVRAWQADFPTAGLLLHLTRTWARMLEGHVREADAEAELQYATAVSERAEYPRVTWCALRGIIAILRGSPGRATNALREGVAVAGDDDRGWLRPMHTYLAMAAALAGDVATAEEHERHAAHGLHSVDGVFGADVARARGWVLAARGELTAAAEEIRAAAQLSASRGQASLEALALHDLARFGHANDVVHRLEELTKVVDGVLVEAFAAHARALADEDAVALDAVADTFDDLTLDLFAAEASAVAASVHRTSGMKARAYASRERAGERAARCEIARSPALARLDATDDLTPREREVADLAAAHLASREIAERLGITRRTVDNLLGRVYTKLGVSGRQELKDVLGKSAP